MEEHIELKIDPETGEILAWETPADIQEDKDKLVEWALQKRAEASAKATGLEAEMTALIEGIKGRMQPQINAQKRRVEWLDKAYEPLFKEYARERIAGTSKKSVSTAWGTVGFRASKGKVVIEDEVAAARTLIDDDFCSPVRIKVDLGELTATGEVEAFQLVKALREVLAHESTAEGLKAMSGVSVDILKSELPDGPISGVRVDLPEDPEGTFYVKS
jgi:hypothetical protein